MPSAFKCPAGLIYLAGYVTCVWLSWFSSILQTPESSNGHSGVDSGKPSDANLLFFILGIVAARIKFDLRMPDAISEFLPIYLLAVIGLHGGLEMRSTGFEQMLPPMVAAVALSLLFTLNHYQILKHLGKFNVFDAYALASTYGAVGAVTFSVGISFLNNQHRLTGFVWLEVFLERALDYTQTT